MNKWEPFTKQEIECLIKESESEMSKKEFKLWNAFKITPEKWQEDKYGGEGGGFWVVAIMGKSVLWYNDIEHGFNESEFTSYGKIDDYFCNQDELIYVIRSFSQYLDLHDKA